MNIGDRVKIKDSEVRSFCEPWRSRFEKGRLGTVVDSPSANVRGWMVEWDHGKVKRPHEWRMVVSERDLELVGSASNAG